MLTITTQKLLIALKTLALYAPVRGAVVVKGAHVVLTAFGLHLWTPAEDAALESLVDAVTGVLLAFGVYQAHQTDPFLH